jgi:hypothetical protein
MTERVSWKALLGVAAILVFIVSSAVTGGRVLGLLALVTVVCAGVVRMQTRASRPAPGEAQSNAGRWVVGIGMALGAFAGVFFAARASGDSGLSAAEQALAWTAVGSALVAVAIRRAGRS